MRLTCLSICFLIVGINSFAQVSGLVYDDETGDPMAFVKVSSGSEKVYSNIDGKFTLKQCKDSILFSYVGYDDMSISCSSELLEIGMKPKQSIEELLIKSDDPSKEIIRRVIENKDLNDPEKRRFSYTAYNKFYFTIKSLDTITFESSSDTSSFNLQEMLEKQHLFFTESITERIHLSANKDKLITRYQKTAGFKDAGLSITASEFQTFSAYSNEIGIGGVQFLNPISKAGLRVYNYKLLQSDFENGDTLLSIQFEPKHNRFKGIKGQLKVDKSTYALVYLDANPINQIANMDIHIKQIYKKQTDSFWFPSELNTLIYFDNESGIDMVGAGRTYIEDTKLDIDGDGVRFNHLSSYVEIDSSFKRSEFDKYVNSKDSATIVFMDSLGQAEDFDKLIRWSKYLGKGQVPLFKYFALQIDELIDFNNHEGFRLGGGISTSDRLTKHMELGGYYAYGFKDKASKLGAHLQINIYPKYQTKLRLSYRNDLQFWGQQTFYSDGFMEQLDIDNIRFLNVNAEQSRRIKAQFSTRLFRHFSLHAALLKDEITGLSDYLFSNFHENIITASSGSYSNVSAFVELSFLFRETFTELFGMQLSDGSDFPHVQLRYEKGLNEHGGQFDYNRVMAKIRHDFNLPGQGKSSFFARAVYTDMTLPLPFTQGLRGSYENFSFASKSSFETMRINEFFADKFVAGGITLNLLRLYKSRMSAPELVLSTKGAIGEMYDSNIHENVDFTVPNNWYLESGIYLDNLLTSQFVGIGLATLYRHGNYQLDKTLDNFSFKLSFNLSF